MAIFQHRFILEMKVLTAVAQKKMGWVESLK